MTGTTSKVLQSSRKVKFLIISDTHDTEYDLENRDHPLSRLPKVDVLLHCGDVTEHGSREEFDRAIGWISKVDADLKLIIPGNHDASLDKKFWLSQNGGVHYTELVQMATTRNKSLKEGGVNFLTEGTHEFTLPDRTTFTIYASPYTPRHGVGAFQPVYSTYAPSITSEIPAYADIVMTHGPPKYILDGTRDGRAAGCEHLRRAVHRVMPLLHCFGHVHTGYGAQRVDWRERDRKEETEENFLTLPSEYVGKNQVRRKGYATLSPGAMEDFEANLQTLFVNAAMQDDGEATNYPWLVELTLPRKSSEG